MQPYFRAPDLVLPGHLHGTGCLSARAFYTGFPTVVWRLRLGLGCGWFRVSAAPRHSWLGCCGVCVLVCLFQLYPATPGWGVQRGCVCLGSCFGCAPPFLDGVLGCVCACMRAPLAPRHSWLGCAVWVCVCFGYGFGCTTPLLAWVLGCVCACVRAPLVARQSWPGCAAWVLCLGPGLCSAPPLLAGVSGLCLLVCAPRLHPATPGPGVRYGCVCLGSGFGCALPRLAQVLWCACLCACPPCTPPLLAGARGVGVCVWVRVSAAPRQSWLGCWGVCVVVWAPPLYPANPGWGVRCGCGYLGLGFGCAPPLLAWVCGVGVCVRAEVSAAARQSWLGCWVVRVCVRAPLVGGHSWLGCATWLCVLGFGFRLRLATLGWVVGVCVCSCARSACTPPLLAGVCSVGVCVWARVLTVPRHSWLGCWDVLVCVCAPPVPRHSWPGCAVWVC